MELDKIMEETEPTEIDLFNFHEWVLMFEEGQRYSEAQNEDKTLY